MRLIKVAGCLSLALGAMIAQAEDKAKVTHLDATAGNVGDHQIVFVGNENSENSTRGTAVAVFMKAGKQELAYGLRIDGNTDIADYADVETVKGLSKLDDPKVTLSKVDVTEEQYTAAMAGVKAFTEKSDHLDLPSQETMNCLMGVLKACGLRAL